MKALIIEDEILAAERLAILIQKYDSNIEILEPIDSVKEAIKWLSNNPHPDLCFMDIQLADGLSFDIFEQVKPQCPIIFTTAYDAYALKAFKVNSIDYLLKPIDFDDLSKAFDQFKQMKASMPVEKPFQDLDVIRQAMMQLNRSYKKRFIVKAGNHITAIPIENILYLYSEHRTVWIKTKTGKKHAIDYTLEQLENLLDPQLFFRLNRKYFTSFEAIKDVLTYTNSRLKVRLNEFDSDELILVSRERVKDFKEWLDQ